MYEHSKKIKPLPGFKDFVTHEDMISLIFRNADGKESNVSGEWLVFEPGKEGVKLDLYRKVR